MKTVAFALLVVLASGPRAQIMKPGVIPLFDVGPPAFMVSCYNTSTSEIRPEGRALVRTWLDGKPLESQNLSLAPRVLYPGTAWRETVRLSQDLVLGPHSIAFECGGGRSDDVQFIWRIFTE